MLVSKIFAENQALFAGLLLLPAVPLFRRGISARKRWLIIDSFGPGPPHRAASAIEAAQAAQASAENISDALKITEIRYRRLFESARDGILLLDSDLGKITDANPFMTELLGYTYAEFIGKELWEIGLLRDKSASQDAFQQLKRDNYIRYEDLPLQNIKGEWRQVEFVSNLYRENGHTVIQCNIRDITDRRHVEAALAVLALKNERIAETLQRSMLQRVPTGSFAGMKVETFYAASMNEADVGGDFFDAFALAEGKAAFVVGDVSGKGLIAAGRTAEVKYAFRAFLHEFPEPEIALAHINDFICQTHLTDADNNEMFIVIAVAVVDATTGLAKFSSAGAEPSLILRADGSIETTALKGTPLGIMPQQIYEVETHQLAHGETLLMATDGITEARRGKEFLGLDGMTALLKAAGPNAPLNFLSQAVYAGARKFAQDGLKDDVCLLLARRE
jgi:PAS domain S-box-containing protein